jgi:hypothetical protein
VIRNLQANPTGTINFTDTHLEEFGCALPSALRKVMGAYQKHMRVCDHGEAGLTMADVDTIYMSDDVIYVSSVPPGQRRSSSSNGHEASIHAVQVYCQRPKELATLSFCRYYQEYRLQPANKPLTRDKKYTKFGTDENANLVYHIDGGRLVRFTDYSPDKIQEWSYNILLSHDTVHFINERELKRTHEDYFLECVKRKIITDMESVHVLIAEYGKRHMLSVDQRHGLVENICAIYDCDDDTGQFTLGAPCTEALATPSHAAEAERLVANMSSTEFDEQHLGTPRAHQLPAYEAVMRKVRAKKGGVIVLIGGPGAGKSHLTKIIIRDVRREFELKVAVAATTAQAAQVISPATATTYHKAFSVPIRGSAPPIETWDPRFPMIKKADVFVVDEMSMLSSKVLLIGHSQITGVRGPEYLQEALTIFVGDGKQLPPVCRHKVDDMGICHMCPLPRSELVKKWREDGILEVVDLPGNERLSDEENPELASFLRLIRDAQPTQAEIDTALRGLVRGSSEADLWPILQAGGERTHFVPADVLHADGSVLAHGDVVVCTHHQDAFNISHRIQKDLLNRGELGSVLYDTRPEHESHAGVAADAVEWMTDTAFHRLEEVAIGSRVMLITK